MTWEIREGHVLDRLRDMPDESIQTVVTSPPYWGLRDYGVDGQLGLEATPEEFTMAMVEVFAEVKRVLRNDGTLWLNIGDSYSRTAGHRGGNFGRPAQTSESRRDTRKLPSGLKEKNLVGIPWRLAFALQADGWYLRRDIIWAKSNPMPESVTDRPTTAHEYVFLLTKRPRYFYDAEAINEPAEYEGPERCPTLTLRAGFTRRSQEKVEQTHTRRPGTDDRGGNQGNGKMTFDPLTRNKRSVWTIATRPFPDAHFATFPPDLVVPCVLAGAPRECCSTCGAPWVRDTETEYVNPGNRSTNGPRSVDRKHEEFGSAGYDQRLEKRVTTTGWSPSCDHDTGGGVPIVLDPFAGAGTTLLVAEQLGRDSIGIELNPEYAALARDRIRRWEHDPAGNLRSATKPVDGQLVLLEDIA